MIKLMSVIVHVCMLVYMSVCVCVYVCMSAGVCGLEEMNYRKFFFFNFD